MRTTLLTVALCIGAACGGAAVDSYLFAAPSAIEIDTAGQLPSQTDLLVALREPIGALVNGVGDPITVEVVQAIGLRDGEVVVPIGAMVRGRVSAIARPATRGNQVAIALRFDELIRDGKSYPLSVEVTEVAPAQVRGEARPGETGIGQILRSEYALSHTGIKVGPRNGSVIGLGMGNVEPVLYTGTRMTLETRSIVPLVGGRTVAAEADDDAGPTVVGRPQQPVAPGIGACGDDSVPAACYW